jgi:protoheme IX farnesyltransferase
LVIVTTFVGYWLGSDWPVDLWKLLGTVVGTALAASSAGALNQAFEYRKDQLMARTADRPVAAGRMSKQMAVGIGIFCGVLGSVLLLYMAGPIPALLAGFTIALYVLLYTPLKRVNEWCTFVGAVAGAIPPVVGWSAVQPLVRLEALVLFGLLFAWQMPHFLAIAWMYRAEYQKAGFVMIRSDDSSGIHTAWVAMWHTLMLPIVTMLPFVLGGHQGLYPGGVLLANLGLFLCAALFVMDRSRPSARRLFLASIAYLPAMLLLMVLTKPR